jgi:two-component system chemotaxis response regulator CheY
MPSVVIVDDALLIRLQLKQFFERQLGFEVVGMGSDGNEAIELYESCKPDLVALDLSMPNRDGLSALTEILQSDDNARILVVSAIKDNVMITEALEKGARGFIAKPLNFGSEEFVDEMRADIEDALAEA